MFAVVPLMIVLMLLATMVMLVSFRRLVMVVAIMPLGLIGVVLALLVFNRPLGFVAILGILALIGMIAKNAVILIVSIEEERATGLARARRRGDLRHQPVAADDADRDVHRARPAADRAHGVLGADGVCHHGRAAGGHAADAGVPARAVHGGARQGGHRAARRRRRSRHDGSGRGTRELELHMGELRQLFDSMDPAPFRERDLDPKAADYIVDWAGRRLPARRWRCTCILAAKAAPTPTMRCCAMRCASTSSAAPRPSGASCASCSAPAASACSSAWASWPGRSRWRVRSAALIRHEGYAWLVSESLIIGGWVALWRPMEIFLYDWWPIRADARLYDRLAAMPVSLRGADAAMGQGT